MRSEWKLKVRNEQKNQFVYTQRSAQVDIQKEKISFGTRFCGTQSLVCYTFVPAEEKKKSVATSDSGFFTCEGQADKCGAELKILCFCLHGEGTNGI